MKLMAKIVGYTVAAIFGLLVIVFISLQFVSGEQYKKWISAATESVTGRSLSIDGDLEVAIGTKIGLSADDVSFANAVWGSRDAMVTLDRLFVEIRLLPLFTGVLDFIVEIDAPDILLETDDNGTGNWVFEASSADPSPSETADPNAPDDSGSFSLPVKPYVRNAEITGLAFVYTDRTQAQSIEAALEHLRIFVEGGDIPLIIKGSYRDAPIDLSGSLGSIEDWHANRQTNVSLSGNVNQANVSIEGTAGPVLPDPDARLNVEVSAATVSTFDAFAGIELPPLEDLDVSFSLIVEKGGLMLEDVRADLNDPRLKAAIGGRVADLAELSGIEISTELSTEKGGDLAAILNFGDAYTLPRTVLLQGTIGGSIDSLSIDGLKLHARDQGLEVELAADLQDVIDSLGGTADLSIDLESTSIISRFAGVEIPSFGPLNGSARLVSTDTGLELEALQLALSDPVLAAQIEGTAKRIGRPGDETFQISGIELSGSAESDQIEAVVQRFGVDVPVSLPASFTLNTAVAGSLEKLGVTDLQALVTDSGLEIALNGTMDNLIDLSGITAEVKASAQDTAILSSYAGVDIPALGSLDLHAGIASVKDTYRVDELELVLDGDTVTAQITGNINDVLALATVADNPAGYEKAGINADLAVQTSSLSALIEKAAGVELEELGALDATAHLGSSAESIRIDALQATLTGEGVKTTADIVLEDLLALSGFKAEIASDLDSLSLLSGLAGTELPQTGPWTVRINAASVAESASGLDFSTQLAGEGIEASIDAQMPDVRSPRIFRTDLQFEADSIARIAALFDRQIPEDKALKVSGTAEGKEGAYLVENLSVAAAGGTLQGDLAYRYPPADGAGRPKLTGMVTIDSFDITPFLIAPENEVEELVTEEIGAQENTQSAAEGVDLDQQEQEENDNTPTSDKKLFSAEPFAVGWLNQYDADFTFEAVDILTPRNNTVDAKIDVLLDQGLLTIEPIELSESSGGTGTGYLKLDARSEAAVLDTVLELDKFSSPRYGGTIDLHVDLDGRGSSPAALMGSLDGYFAVSLKDLEMPRSYLSQFGAGLLKQLNPLDSDKTLLECGVVRFDIEDGVADFRKRIAAQTTEVTWLGGGKINLKTEELDVGISPRARGAISSITNIDLASLVHIGGTLAEPKLGVDLADVAKKYASYTAFFATGGLSFLAEKVVATAQANVDQCERILGELEELEEPPDTVEGTADKTETETKGE